MAIMGFEITNTHVTADKNFELGGKSNLYEKI